MDFHLVGVEVVHHLQEDSQVDYLVAGRKVEDMDDFEVDKHGQVVDMIGLVVGDQVVLVEDSSVEGSLVVDNLVVDIQVVDSVDSLVVDMVDSLVPHGVVVDMVLAALVQDSPVDRLLVVDILDILVVVVVLLVLILEQLLDRCLVDKADILVADSWEVHLVAKLDGLVVDNQQEVHLVVQRESVHPVVSLHFVIGTSRSVVHVAADRHCR